jgi:hypothetical protein
MQSICLTDIELKKCEEWGIERRHLSISAGNRNVSPTAGTDDHFLPDIKGIKAEYCVNKYLNEKVEYEDFSPIHNVLNPYKTPDVRGLQVKYVGMPGNIFISDYAAEWENVYVLVNPTYDIHNFDIVGCVRTSVIIKHGDKRKDKNKKDRYYYVFPSSKLCKTPLEKVYNRMKEIKFQSYKLK